MGKGADIINIKMFMMKIEYGVKDATYLTLLAYACTPVTSATGKR